MNIENLSDEEKRVKIAEACGWTPVKPWEVSDDLRLYAHPNRLPDYLNDLNAMHEAEKTLTYEQWSTYVDALIDSDIPDGAVYRGYQSIHATSRQRADAFLLSL